MNTKGAVEVQVNWIFVLVVGALILIFFTGIIMKQKSVSEQKYSITVKEHLDALFTSSEVASGTALNIDIPDVRIDFDCNNYYVGEFGSDISKHLGQTRVIFAPTTLQGKRLITWSVEWNLPYKIIDFLYVTSREMRYVIVHADGAERFAEELYDALPDVIDKGSEVIHISTLSSIRYQNNYKTRFIFVDEQGSSPQTLYDQFRGKLHPSFEGADVSALQIVPSSSEERGDVIFYALHHTGVFYPVTYTQTLAPAQEMARSTSFYVDYNSDFVSEHKYPTLFGAIFTDDLEIYGCMIDRAMRRHGFITQVYLNRVESMTSNPSSRMVSRGCVRGLYGTDASGGIGALRTLLSSSSNCIEGVSCTFHGINDLITANKKIQFESCPLIY